TPGENWYNDASASGLNTDNNDAWTGSSSGYFTASHSLAAIAGETSVLLRIAFGSDGSGIDEGVAIDNFVVAEAAGIFPAESVVTQVVAETLPTINGLHETHGPFPVLVLDFDQPLGPVTLDSITVTNAGSIMDADIFWHLFADDGDGFFDISVDTQLAAMIAQSGGSATLSTGGTALPSFDTQRFFIVAELAVNAMPGNTIVASVAANTDIVFAGTPTTTLSAPYTADTVTLNPVISTFPFEDDFSVFDPSFTGLDGEGTKLQTANEVGPVGNPTDYGNDGFITLVTSQGNLLPVSGTSFLQLDYDSLAGQAFQYAFDMSAFSVANNEHIWVGFRWSHTGDENDPEENVFLSLDGGSSYLGSVYHFEKNSGNDEVWNEDFIDLFDVLNAASLDYTDNIVIRWQGNDETAIPADGMYFDRIQVGFPPELVLERSATVFLDGDTDAQGSIPALPQSVTYNVANGGDLDLVLDAGGFTVANEMGVSNVTVTQPANLTVPNGAMETLVVDFEPALGAFSFDLTVPTNGPSLTGSSYTITISGTATTPAPDISVERPAGTEIASGSTDGQGDQPVEMAQELVYTIVNTGNIDLNLQGINVLNAANTTAALTVAPMGVLAPTETTTFAVSYTPTAAGPFSFEVSIGNDDPDESPYVIIVEGDGTDTSGVGGGGPTTTTGAGGSGGDGGAGGDADGDDDGSDDDGGCSCSTPGSSRSQAPPTSLLVFGGMLVVAARRRRRR
ncbi:MAG: MYXO-CTERM sorting domain-containing protein, partial [Planctomycetota bacterium]